MPEDSKDSFRFPSIHDTAVGQRVFLIHRDGWDGNPSLMQSIKTRVRKLGGLFDQEVLSVGNFDLRHDRWSGLYPTADGARAGYIASARWDLEHRYTDPKRPGDQMGIQSLQKNVNILLRTPWVQAQEQARQWLEATLADLGETDLPVQRHLVGAQVRTREGMRAVLGEVHLLREFDGDTCRIKPFALKYWDEDGYPIELEEQSSETEEICHP